MAMNDILLLIGALAATGLAAGLIAGLLGVGGGIVVVPVLFQVFGLLGYDDAVRMHLSVGTSLMTIIPTSIISLRSHAKKSAVDFALLKSWAPAILVGSSIGAGLAGYVRGEFLSALFACLALGVAAQMTLMKPDFRISDHLPKGILKAGIGGGIGALSSMIGIGGGTLSVPVLTYCSYPMRQAVGTASAIGLVIALPGAIGFMLTGMNVEGRPPLSLGYVSLLGFALIAPATMLAAPWGARIAHSINPLYLRRAFGVFLALTALKFFISLF